MRRSAVWRIGAGMLVLLLLAACSRAPAPSGAPGPAGQAPQQPAWSPQRPIEFVVTTNPGGGSDLYARFMAQIVEKYKLSPQPLVVVNKPGGAGAVGMQYLHSKRGDPHAVLITLNSVFTTPYLQKLPFSSIADDFTPVALVALDPFVLWVNRQSRWQTFQDFIAEARQRSITVGGTGSRQEDEILFNLLQRAAGTQPFKYTPFEGGGAVAAALAGGHIEATVNQPSEAAPHYPDRVRPLVVFQEQRNPLYPDVPTIKEAGLDRPELIYYQVRGIVAAPGIELAAQKWLTDLFKKIYDTQDWQDYLKQNLMVGRFLGGDEFKKFLQDYVKLHADLIRALNWAQ